MRRLFVPVLGLLAPAWASAQPPAPQTIDQLAEQVAGIRRQRAELDKAEGAALAGIAAELKRQRELLERLGIDGPAPKPPAPPAPPADPLRAKLKAALDASAGTAAEKGEWARDLAALYRAAAKLTAEPGLATAGTLRLKLKEAAAALIGEAALREVRQAVAAELAAVLPTTDAELTPDQREAAARLFKVLAAHLEELAK
ncbi:hypothetical protein R5W24_006356 [Gemmata sp. JC717]|uniref:hypothetical protein n=1 Tax=Gemmata algarum TaxID=2975278 RepID=UPI0021BAB830|nr:hypothetical protein [Gemmata algarum]MDY3557169.1 hypothetical protein [Gemmata algarum]